ncbi:MAG: RagB/SusD family nutrient uptake outer membrane protein [Bacteroidia bacterium]|nr:RagB/SusD family nutrient uptake outer membrane protein [Bacteroidia bacterium]
MKTKKIILLGFIIALLGSCVKYLEPYPNGNYDSETLWQYQNLVQGLIGYCYDNVNSNNRNYADNEGVYLDGATDDAVVTSSTNVMRRYAVNTMTTSQDPFATYWDRDYRSIRNCNLFLKDRRGYNTKFILNSHWNDLVKNRLQGEAFALRAFFEWDLLQKFGGKGTDGTMLGFPIVTDVFNATDDINLARNTYDDCVKQIIADCDSAWKYLPIAHRDYLVAAADLGYAGGKYWNRFDGITMRAIKAQVYLTWASPRFNPANNVSRWDSAAYNAKKVMDFKMTKDVVVGNTNSFNPTNGVVWTNPNSPEIVFGTRWNTSNLTMERLFYPGGFQGTASVGATQELVDAFPMANGRPITDPLSLYNPANPYTGRDPRFYSSIFYNTAPAKLNNTGATMYTFENWNAGPTVGKDAAGTKSDNTRTNYYIKKYIFMGYNPTAASPSSVTHSKFIVRWAHMVLTFAEAANHVTHNPNTALYGMTPKAAIKLLRVRKTYDNATGLSATDPYLDEQTTEAAFDALVKNERRIETCFEGMRFYDLRRWTTDATWGTVINSPVHGAYITQVPGTPVTYTYNLNYVVEVRNFPSPYNPIPYSEMLRMSKLIQNEGWPSWN